MAKEVRSDFFFFFFFIWKALLFLPVSGEPMNNLSSVLRKLGYSGRFYTSEVKSSREESPRREVDKILPLLYKQNLQFRMILSVKTDVRRHSLLLICILSVRTGLEIHLLFLLLQKKCPAF